MRTDKINSDFDMHACRFNNCLAYEHYDYKKSRFIYLVFTDISHKRFKASGNNIWRETLPYINKTSRNSIIFITNKQLLDMTHPFANYHFIKDIKKLVFDAKIGTKYNRGDYFNGSYFDCLQVGNVPKPNKKVS